MIERACNMEAEQSSQGQEGTSALNNSKNNLHPL